MPLTSDQLTILQGLIGITDDETVFTDDNLDLLFTEASENLYGTAVLAISMIIVNAAKRNAYTLGQTSEQAQQVVDNLEKVLKRYQKLADAGVTPSSAQIVGMRSVPPPYYTLPDNDYTRYPSYPYGRKYPWRPS